MNKKMKIGFSVAVIVGVILVALSFSIRENVMQTQTRSVEVDGEIVIEGWMNVDLVDVKSGDSFKISDFKKPVVLESFAVWCPTCKIQQDQIKKLINEGDDSIHLSIDTDPNEDKNSILAHINRYSYEWIFAIFPKEATKSLIDEFGVGVVNAPSAPVIIVCPNGSSWLLKRGVKSSSTLKQEVAKC